MLNNKMDHIFSGIDIGGTKIRVGIVSGEGKIIATSKTPTPKSISPVRLAVCIFDQYEKILKENNLNKKNVAGVGIGIPGIIDMDSGVIVRAPNLNMSGVNFRSILKKKFKIPVAIANDVNLGLLGEQWKGAAMGARNAVSIFAGTGIGGGILINGRLYTGCNGAAAEIGHMVVVHDGLHCTCGNNGCLEALCGRWAIERDIKRAVKKGKETIVEKMLDGNFKKIKSRILAKALKAKDPVVTRIMKEVSRHLGSACVSLRHLFDPEVIVLGGGVIGACGEYMLPIIEKAVNKDKLFSGLGKCKIVVSELQDNAVILGAVALVKKPDSLSC
ncbi:MAG: ROK family protein [Elusimicrobia bacterium]|nr:ROK family protein [Candidatus Liberimonas magnetica]